MWRRAFIILRIMWGSFEFQMWGQAKNKALLNRSHKYSNYVNFIVDEGSVSVTGNYICEYQRV